MTRSPSPVDDDLPETDDLNETSGLPETNSQQSENESAADHRAQHAPAGNSRAQHRWMIQQEITRVQRQAALARLQAREEELQQLLTRLDAGEDISRDEYKRLGIAPDNRPTKLNFNYAPHPVADSGSTQFNLDHAAGSGFRFRTWDDVRVARGSAKMDSPKDPRWTRRDAGQPDAVPAPAMRGLSLEEASSTSTETLHSQSPERDTLAGESHASEFETLDNETSDNETSDNETSDNETSDNETLNNIVADERATIPESESDRAVAVDLLTTSDDQTASESKTRPRAFLFSTLAHLGLILILMMVTMTSRIPKDQVALSASVSEGDEATMETFSIETNEPTSEPAESAPAETAYDLSPIGEMMAVDVTADMLSQAPPTDGSLASLSSQSRQGLRSVTAGGTSNSKMEFCGVEGGGNHFVYLVDSSGSMGDAFTSARRALLQSIDMLTEKQRFYVVFFDAKPDFMRLRDPETDEPRSVYATAENKQRLRNWVMRIEMDRGRAPYDPLRFALELKPDVIFLLSDGEFPQGIEDLLAEENKVTNLFGDTNPISIVHTISYHSQEGESRMRRIAQQNAGQYRYIPAP